MFASRDFWTGSAPSGKTFKSEPTGCSDGKDNNHKQSKVSTQSSNLRSPQHGLCHRSLVAALMRSRLFITSWIVKLLMSLLSMPRQTTLKPQLDRSGRSIVLTVSNQSIRLDPSKGWRQHPASQASSIWARQSWCLGILHSCQATKKRRSTTS